MAVRWERLAGDTGVFAFKVGFADDPDHGQGIDPEVATSWGSFQIWIEGRNLCAHREDGGQVDSVHWYLLPLIEWFAANWNPLLHEERLPVQNMSNTAWESLRSTRFPPLAIENNEEDSSAWESEWQQWWTRHALRSAREGGLFPDLVLRRLRDSIEISWGPTQSSGMPFHFSFLESVQGSSRLPPRDVAEPLHDVLSSASNYLLTQAPDSARIQALDRSLRGLSSVDESDRRIMWLAGLGTDEKTVRTGWDRVQNVIAQLGEASRAVLEIPDPAPLVVAGSCQAALLFGSLAPNIGHQDIVPLARTMVDLSSADRESAAMTERCRSVPLTAFDPPWSQGYELAEALHQDLDMRFVLEARVDVAILVQELGIKVIDLELSDKNIRGVSIAGKDHRPGIVVNTLHYRNAHPFGLRFTLAHELCHVLFDREEGRRLAVASGPWAPRSIEQRANAFAAMLLMPPSLIERAAARLHWPLDSKEGVREAAYVLETSVDALLHHLRNTGFITDTDRERIEDEMLSPSDPP